MMSLLLALTSCSLVLLQLCHGESLLQSPTWALSQGTAKKKDPGTADDQIDSRGYWEQLVGAPSRLARLVKKEGVLPPYKYSVRAFDVAPFEVWLREYSLLPGLLQEEPVGARARVHRPPAPPLASACSVWTVPQYKIIIIVNRDCASSIFLSALTDFMHQHHLCTVSKDPAVAHPNTCVMRLKPKSAVQEGQDLAAMWRDYLVITSSRNPWARAASGYQVTYHKWIRRDGSCSEPTFLEFCGDPFIMGKMANLFNCSGQVGGPFDARDDVAWGADFSQVEPAAACMVDDMGRLVVDFVMRYERLDEDMQEAVKLINARRPTGLPAIEIPSAVKWRNKGSATQSSDVNSTNAAAFAYADKYRQCGAPCIDALSDFYEADLRLFGWDRPGPPPPA